jgi:hypothetical protein
MGRGARPKVRWASDRTRKKKERDKRAAEARGKERKAAKKK